MGSPVKILGSPEEIPKCFLLTLRYTNNNNDHYFAFITTFICFSGRGAPSHIFRKRGPGVGKFKNHCFRENLIFTLSQRISKLRFDHLRHVTITIYKAVTRWQVRD